MSQASITSTLPSRSLRARQRLRRAKAALALAIVIGGSACVPTIAAADEGGVSFWIPGFFASLAAAPLQPGWSLTDIYYHTSVSAGSGVALAREFQIGKIPVNLSANLSANVNATGDLGIVYPNYTFATPVLGGQLSVGALAIYGTVGTSLAGTLTGTLTAPGGSIPFMRSDSISDSVWGFGDMHPAGFAALELRRS